MPGHARRSVTNDAGRRPVVLVVENEDLLRSTTAEYLRLSGYVVIEAANAAEAIEIVASGEAVDVVFSDVHLPGALDGLGLARWLRRHHDAIPVMLTTGYGETAHAVALVGDEAFAKKPYRQREVANRLGRLLARARNRAT